MAQRTMAASSASQNSLARIQEENQRLRKELGDVQMHKSLIEDSLRKKENEIFDMHLSVCTLEYELNSRQPAEGPKVETLQSQLNFATNQLTEAKRDNRLLKAQVQKEKALRSESNRQKAQEKLRSRKRKATSSADISSTQAPSQASSEIPTLGTQRPPQSQLHSTATASQEKEQDSHFDEENARVIASLLSSPSHDLLTLLCGQDENKSADPTPLSSNRQEMLLHSFASTEASMSFANSSRYDTRHESTLGTSRGMNDSSIQESVEQNSSMFLSQSIPQHPSNVQSSLQKLQTISPPARSRFMDKQSKSLFFILGDMAGGGVKATALLPILTAYLEVENDADAVIIATVTRLLSSLISECECVRSFLLQKAGSYVHRGIHRRHRSGIFTNQRHISVTSARQDILVHNDDMSFMDEAIVSKDRAHLRERLHAALGSALRRHVKSSPIVVENILMVIRNLVEHSPTWYEQADLHWILGDHLLETVLMCDPKLGLGIQVEAIGLLHGLLRCSWMVSKVTSTCTRSDLLHAIVKLLDHTVASLANGDFMLLRQAQKQALSVLHAFVKADGEQGVRFIIQRTPGLVKRVVRFIEKETREMDALSVGADGGMAYQLVATAVELLVAVEPHVELEATLHDTKLITALRSLAHKLHRMEDDDKKHWQWMGKELERALH